MAEEPISAEIILYQAGGTNVPVEVRYQDETMWMPQAQIAELFGTTKQNSRMASMPNWHAMSGHRIPVHGLTLSFITPPSGSRQSTGQALGTRQQIHLHRSSFHLTGTGA